MKKRIWRPAHVLAVSVLAASVLTACTVSLPGGLVGGAFSVLLLLFLLTGAATSTGCDPEDDDSAPDAYVGPCLSAPPPEMGVMDAEIGPCLSAPPPEMGVIDAEIGPCLSAPPPEMGVMDAAVGPCLSQLPPDMGVANDASVGPCLSQLPPDMGMPADAGADAEADAEQDAGEVEEPPVGPCLSPPAPGSDRERRHGMNYQEAPPISPDTVDRKSALARVLERGGLPADVISRLTSEQDDEQG